MHRRSTLILIAALASAAFAPGDIPSRRGAHGLTAFPDAPRLCGGGARLFARCRPQADILNAAIAEAKRQDKVLLIEVGADWCASCHVFDRYFDGWFVAGAEPRAAGTASDARALGRFVQQHFVLARLDTDQADVHAALRTLGLRKDVSRGVPAFYMAYAGRARQVHLLDSAVRSAGRGTAFSRPALAAKLRHGLNAVRPGAS